jgi:hypothetical protein
MTEPAGRFRGRRRGEEGCEAMHPAKWASEESEIALREFARGLGASTATDLLFYSWRGEPVDSAAIARRAEVAVAHRRAEGALSEFFGLLAEEVARAPDGPAPVEMPVALRDLLAKALIHLGAGGAL